VAAPHDVPTAAQLVEAVREWLERDVIPAGGGLGFNARVAANMLAMVEREFSLGDEQAAAHQQRLTQLGVSDDADLARQIRRGEFDDRLDQLLPALRATVADKLAVANPKYLG
jgi:hypothetical protein